MDKLGADRIAFDWNQIVPHFWTSFRKIRFNAAVMGFGRNLWLDEALAFFDNVVLNVAHLTCLQEECDVLLLCISRVAKEKMNFDESPALSPHCGLDS